MFRVRELTRFSVRTIALIVGLFSLFSSCQSDLNNKVDVICEKVYLDQAGVFSISYFTCKSKLNLLSDINTRVGNIFHVNGSKVAVDSIEMFSINDAKKFNFIPFGLKKSFPRLKAIRVLDSFLIHLDQQDMQQFGADLQNARFWNTKLTALEEGLFIFNSNLIYIDFDGNPLKYIDPQLFENFKRMKSLEIVELAGSGCISQRCSIKNNNPCHAFNWNSTCNEITAKSNNVERIHKRMNLPHMWDALNILRNECMKRDEKVESRLEKLDQAIKQLKNQLDFLLS